MDGWPTGTKLTWKQVVKLVGSRLSMRTTRQTLARDEKIKAAFDTRKTALHKEGPATADKGVLAQRLHRVTAQRDRLEEENARLGERFVQLQYNAYKHGLTKHQLEEPLPEVDRHRST